VVKLGDVQIIPQCSNHTPATNLIIRQLHLIILYTFFFFWWDWDLNSGFKTGKAGTPPVHFALVILEMGS
jgi:hypothetical protein